MTPTLLMICPGTCFLRPWNEVFITTAREQHAKEMRLCCLPRFLGIKVVDEASPSLTSLPAFSSSFTLPSISCFLLFFQGASHTCALETQNWLFPLPVTFFPQINANYNFTSFTLWHQGWSYMSLYWETKIKMNGRDQNRDTISVGILGWGSWVVGLKERKRFVKEDFAHGRSVQFS